MKWSEIELDGVPVREDELLKTISQEDMLVYILVYTSGVHSRVYKAVGKYAYAQLAIAADAGVSSAVRLRVRIHDRKPGIRFLGVIQCSTSQYPCHLLSPEHVYRDVS